VRNTCRMTRWSSSSLLLSLALAFPGLGAAADWGVNVYGLSRHFDRAKARELHVDNELNPGLGLRYRVPQGERLDWIFDTGFYRDSEAATAPSSPARARPGTQPSTCASPARSPSSRAIPTIVAGPVSRRCRSRCGTRER